MDVPSGRGNTIGENFRFKKKSGTNLSGSFSDQEQVSNRALSHRQMYQDFFIKKNAPIAMAKIPKIPDALDVDGV